MPLLNICFYQSVTTSTVSRFTWGEGYDEREITHYGPLKVYLEGKQIPNRLLVDLKIIKYKNNNNSTAIRDEILNLIDNSYLCFKDSLSSLDNPIDIDTINISGNYHSLYKLNDIDDKVLEHLLYGIDVYEEDVILRYLRLEFENDYIKLTNNSYVSKLLNKVFLRFLNIILSKKLSDAISSMEEFEWQIIYKRLSDTAIEWSSELRYITISDVRNCIDNLKYKCAELFIDRKLKSLLNNNESRGYNSIINSIAYCFNEYGNSYKELLDNSSTKIVYELLKEKADNLLALKPPQSYKFIKDYLHSFFPDFIISSSSYSYLFDSFSRKCVESSLDKISNSISELECLEDCHAVYYQLQLCIPSINDHSYDKQYNKCILSLILKVLDILISQTTYYDTEFVYDYCMSCLGQDDQIELREFFIKQYYVEKWLEKTCYVEKFLNDVLMKQDFHSRQEYERFAQEYLNDDPCHFDGFTINIILRRTFEQFEKTSKYIPIELPKIELKVIGKINLDE